jgi:sugar phosphate isomerase/epimerase
MCDGEGNIGDPDNASRTTAIENHYKWVDAAVALGCHSIRVNAQSAGSPDEQRKLAADGLRRLTEHAEKQSINVIVENHGGISSNGEWLASVMVEVDHERCGTLPDFGNFILDWITREEYDRYKGMAELMPFAKAVSAKSHDFDKDGNETHTDYRKMLSIVLDAGYRGWIGVEYEGNDIGEFEGIIRTKDLLERIRDEREENA